MNESANSRVKTVVDVSTGEVQSGRGLLVFRSSALGSCIAVAAVDALRQVGGMAHFMLPGRCPANREPQTRYIWNGLQELLRQLGQIEARRESLAIVLAGGGNVLRRQDDQICADNIRSIRDCLSEENLAIHAQSIGGEKRRCLSLDLAEARVYCTIGEEPEELLWKAESKN